MLIRGINWGMSLLQWESDRRYSLEKLAQIQGIGVDMHPREPLPD
jgi:hypothetical protein